MIIQLFLFIFPWKIRKFFLSRILGFELDENVKIGYSIILAKKVVLKRNVKIGHLNFIKRIDTFYMDENSKMGSRNWVTGFSVTHENVRKYSHFAHIANRQCVLSIGKDTSVTSRHYFDCNGGIYIGDYCTIAGFETAFMTHSIDLKNNRQDASPIRIGNYNFIGARCTILKGAVLPDCSVLGACSLLNKQYNIPGLYAGNPAKFIKSLDNYSYFERVCGFVR